MKPQKPFFDTYGKATRGIHAGKHATELPADYVTFCASNTDGWRLQYEAALKGEPPPKAKRMPRPKGEVSLPGPMRSSQGARAGSIKNAGLAKPGQKKFTWRSR